MEDIRQETLCRVLRAAREKNEVADGRKLGAYVCGVCNYVTLELTRGENKNEGPDGDSNRRPDPTQDDPDASLIDNERRPTGQTPLADPENRDRHLLAA